MVAKLEEEKKKREEQEQKRLAELNVNTFTMYGTLKYTYSVLFLDSIHIYILF